MEALVIGGGNPLCGTVEINGAKNAALPLLAATVLHGGTYILHNCPDITDVALAAEIIEALGGRVHRAGKTLTVDTQSVTAWRVPAELMARMRASVLFLGPLLGRFGRAVLTMPGGCPLGKRPIDLHLDAVAQMGAAVTLQEGEIRCEASKLHGCTIDLLFPSVGATENALLAAAACRGTVIIRNAAREPEIACLAEFLRAMGAEISGVGTETLTVAGGRPLGDAACTVLPDRIETATYLCAAAGCGGDITLLHTDGGLLLPVLETLSDAGCRVEQAGDCLKLRSDGSLRAAGTIQTAPYPGFPTDAQALVMAALLRADGCTRFSETIFERRFSHVAQLRRFGAEIETAGPTALVRGVRQLHAAEAGGSDLRASAAIVIAALQAPGESRIYGINHLHRGYDNLEGGLRKLGAEIGQENDWKFPTS